MSKKQWFSHHLASFLELLKRERKIQALFKNFLKKNVDNTIFIIFFLLNFSIPLRN